MGRDFDFRSGLAKCSGRGDEHRFREGAVRQRQSDNKKFTDIVPVTPRKIDPCSARRHGGDQKVA